MIEFAQPAALWTALAVGLPVFAHMAYRRVTEKFYFPSLRFIRPSQIPRTGKRTPSDIPLFIEEPVVSTKNPKDLSLNPSVR